MARNNSFGWADESSGPIDTTPADLPPPPDSGTAPSRADVDRIRLSSLYAAFYALPTSGIPLADLPAVDQQRHNLQCQIAEVKRRLAAPSLASGRATNNAGSISPLAAKPGQGERNAGGGSEETAHQTIAAELRLLPGRGDSEAERYESAGRLLLAAIAAGVFSGASWLVFREMVRQRAEEPSPKNGYICAWYEALGRLRGRNSHENEDFAADCNFVADLIESWRGVKPEKNKGKGDPTPQEPTLTDKHIDTLESLRLLKATSRDKRKTAAEIAKKFAGEADAALVKEPLAELTGWGYVESVQGRSGGSWLTRQGRKRLTVEKRKR